MRWWLGLVFCVAVLSAAVPASADTEDEVREALRGLQLCTAMLYPDALPPRVRDADVSPSTEGDLRVVWDRGRVSPDDDNRVGFVSIDRASRSQLAVDLRTARQRGFKPRRVRVGDRHVWRICGHVCGYAWIENRRYYGVYGIYYVGDESGQTVDRDQRYLIRQLMPLR